MTLNAPVLTHVSSVGAGTEPEDVGFDTSLTGTPESCWNSLELSPWSPEDGGLIIVAPHPDDETLGAGGLIYTWAERQLPVTIISVTDGEAACPEVADLASIRQRELRDALLWLSAGEAKVIRVGIPDGRVRYCRTALADALRSAISGPATLIAPFERDGHPDHDAAGAVAREIAVQNGVRIASYPIWAWHQATPRDFAGQPVVSFSLTRAARAAKHRAIQCYVSQQRERPGGPILPPHVLSYFNRPYEIFVL